jgi:1,4-alpha-glucan branching enzyme
MGSELAQWREWAHDDQLDWRLLEHDSHRQIQSWIADLNRVYRAEPALHELDCEPAGFEWIDGSDAEQSVVSFLRVSKDFHELVLVVANYTPVPRYNYRVGVPRGGIWVEILNSDSRQYGGTDFGNLGGTQAQPQPCHSRPFSLNLTLPPLGALFFKSA